jgi:hypothetical protein
MPSSCVNRMFGHLPNSIFTSRSHTSIPRVCEAAPLNVCSTSSLLAQADILIETTDFLPTRSPDFPWRLLFDSAHLLQSGFCDHATRRELFEPGTSSPPSSPKGLVWRPEILYNDLWDLDLSVRQLVRSMEIDIWPGKCLGPTLECCKPEVALHFSRTHG